jgi:hypothetical protein
MRSHHYSRQIEQAYCYEAIRFIGFPSDSSASGNSQPESETFLMHLAANEKAGIPMEDQVVAGTCCFTPIS